MTRREEQIDNAAQEYIDSDNAVLTYSDGFCEQTDHPFVWAAFKAGAQWADKTMIDKACDWITEHINIPYEGEFIDDSPVASDYIEWCEKRLEYAKAIADAFKQAMEE